MKKLITLSNETQLVSVSNPVLLTVLNFQKPEGNIIKIIIIICTTLGPYLEQAKEVKINEAKARGSRGCIRWGEHWSFQV